MPKEVKTKEPPSAAKPAKVKRDVPAEENVDEANEEEKPVNIIIIRKSPKKRKTKPVSKRQHSIAAKKRWIARKAQKEKTTQETESEEPKTEESER